jgi:hypothetical protein
MRLIGVLLAYLGAGMVLVGIGLEPREFAFAVVGIGAMLTGAALAER